MINTLIAVLALLSADPRIEADGAEVKLVSRGDQIEVKVADRGKGVGFVKLVWPVSIPTEAKLFGGYWERTYGEILWHDRADAVPFAWYVLASTSAGTDAYGVKVQPGAFACWEVGDTTLTLTLDCRAGSDRALLGARILDACTIVTRRTAADETPFAAARAFAKRMCDRTRLPKQPVYGYNDWYCAYGKNTAANFLEDARAVLSLAEGLSNRPFAVADDGWQEADSWRAVSERWAMPMDRVAAKLKASEIRPGLWYRPLKHFSADPTLPKVAETIRGDFAAFRSWGMELVKIDFLTFDWAHTWLAKPCLSPVVRDDLHWRDRSRTTAEIVRGLYALMREAAGEDMVLIGCNALDHFAAGLFEVQRTGDDTSGCDWALTRKCGPNALAARAAHHGAFYQQDGDCAGLSFAGAIDWERNRQWIDLLSRSGGAFFVSWFRDFLDDRVKTALKAAFARASRPQPAAEPLDWMEQPSPEKWIAGGERVDYDWNAEDPGAKPETKFLVLGDLHYCNLDNNGDPAEKRVERLAADVKKKGWDYDFILQLGDLVNCQTGYTPRVMSECHAEWEYALSEVKRLFPDKPFLTTLGNHDWYGGDSWQGGGPCIKRHFIPFMQRELGQPMNGLPIVSFRVNDCLFLEINHLGMDPAIDVETKRMVDLTLDYAERDPSVKRVFAFSHPELWNVDFFRFHENAALLPRFMKAKKFDCYFSGHIHINNLTARRNDYGFTLRQLCAAGTWPPIDEGPKKFHPVPWLTLNPAPSVKHFEEHPADVQSYTLVTASKDRVRVRFEAVGGGNLGEYEWSDPYETKVIRAADSRWNQELPRKVTKARLYYLPYFVDRFLGPAAPPRVKLNGSDIGELKRNQSFFHTNWGAFYLEVDPALLRRENTVEISNISGERFLVRDLSLMAADEQGAEHFTPVYPKVLSFGDWRCFYMGFGLAHPSVGIIHSGVDMNIPAELLETIDQHAPSHSFQLSFR